MAKGKRKNESETLVDKDVTTKAEKKRSAKSSADPIDPARQETYFPDDVAEIELRIKKRYRRRSTIIFMMLGIAIAVILLSSAYMVINFIEYNSLKITVDRSGIGTALTLSENLRFDPRTSVLDASGPQYMDNVTYKTDIDQHMDKILFTEGSSNGINYIAYTFFVANLSSDDVSYREVIEVLSSSRRMQDAMRILVVKDTSPEDSEDGFDGSWNVYATTYGNNQVEAVIPYYQNRTGGAPSMYGFRGKTLAQWRNDVHYNYFYDEFGIDPDSYPSPHGAVVSSKGEWLTTPFASDDFVINSSFYPLTAYSTIKYSIVIWLEGWDPDCIDQILGGMVSLNIVFTTQSQEEYQASR